MSSPDERNTNTESKEEVRDDQLEQAVAHLSKAAELLGFAIAIPKPKSDDDPIEGFIVGTPDYIEKISQAHASLFGEKDGETKEVSKV